MVNAFLWGLLATSSLIIGGMLASNFTLKKSTLGKIMAFGAGTLIAAVSYELVFEALQLAKGTGYPVAGFFGGAFTYYFSETFIDRMNLKNKPRGGETQEQSALLVPMVLAIILDGIPESVVIGLGLFEGGKVSIAMLAAVFISNLPEAIAGTTGMIASGWSKKKITALWLIIAVVCAASTVAGYSVFSAASNNWLSFIQAFAGGAILVMLANSMMPESFEYGGKKAGIFTVLGFYISVVMLMVEEL